MKDARLNLGIIKNNKNNNMKTETETKSELIEKRINTDTTRSISIGNTGNIMPASMSELMEFAKLMAISGVAVPKHLRDNPGACLAVCIQASEWQMSGYAVANKSYSVNDRLAYESQLVNAVILQRAPIVGRFGITYSGEGEKRKCKVTAKLRNGDTVEYESPELGKINPKNSPLWKTDPDQQLFFYSSRAMCRRHFPDVILGVYSEDEIGQAPPMRDVTGKAHILPSSNPFRKEALLTDAMESCAAEEEAKPAEAEKEEGK